MVRGRFGFTLVETAVAVAAAGILAGMMVPLALKVQDQRRAASTREGLRRAFEALFGAHGHRVPNLRADFGFDPGSDLDALPMLVRGDRWGAVPRFGRNDGAAFDWGHNGPYWHGPVLGENPVDAWGSPIRLEVRRARGVTTWQLRSLGPDKAQGADDLVYPPVPASASSYTGSLLVTVTGAGPATASLRHGGNQRPGLVLARGEGTAIPARIPGSHGVQFAGVPSGMAELRILPLDPGGFAPVILPVDLPPGQPVSLQVAL